MKRNTDTWKLWLSAYCVIHTEGQMRHVCMNCKSIVIMLIKSHVDASDKVSIIHTYVNFEITPKCSVIAAIVNVSTDTSSLVHHVTY